MECHITAHAMSQLLSKLETLALTLNEFQVITPPVNLDYRIKLQNKQPFAVTKSSPPVCGR